MKKIALIIIVLTIIACKNEAPIDYTLVKGKISNYQKSKIYIGSKKIEVNQDGTFSDTLELKSGTYKLADPKNNINIYIDPGFNLTINYDFNDFSNTLTFAGKGAEECYYIIKKEKDIAKLKEEGKAIYKLSEEAYKTKFDEIRLNLNSRINSIKNSSSKFRETEKRYNTYFYLGKLASFEKRHGHFTNNPDFKVSEHFTEVLKKEKIDYTNGYDFIKSKDYKVLVNSYYTHLAIERAKIDSSKWGLTYFKILSELNNDTIKNILAFESAKHTIKFTEDKETYYSAFMALSTNQSHKNYITRLYEKQSIIAKGSPSPKFINYKNFAGGTTSLDDFKGKYIYIDVWATWCGPCKSEIPFLKEVEKKYHNKNIEFVSISIDKAADYDKWKTMVKDLNLTGIQLIADKAWKSQFVRDYLINGIPRFILIDPKGNIISASAPIPSNPKLLVLLNSLDI